MKIHEYQAKDVLRRYKVAVPEGHACFQLQQVTDAVLSLGLPCVIKAQVHAGGRGKGGGVKVVQSMSEALACAEKLLGSMLVTPQTTAEGQKVNCVLVEKASEIASELYLGLVVDRDTGRVCIMASSEGGMDIEEVAANTPEKILKEWVNPALGLMPFQIRNIAQKLALSGEIAKKFAPLLNGLYMAFMQTDASLLEINPLVITKKQDLIALDAKIDVDDNALFRQKNIQEMYDPTQDDPRDVEAQHHGLSYVALEGNIGCMVNGAGLAMATMDIIKQVGGQPANFLDVGGSATQDKVKQALKIILQDTQVKAVFINVFGGIAKCDVIAKGILGAAAELGINVPLVARLEGTNVDLGKEILKNSNLSVMAADSMLDGAQKVVKAASQMGGIS